jgi:hypothetical protein
MTSAPPRSKRSSRVTRPGGREIDERGDDLTRRGERGEVPHSGCGKNGPQRRGG